MTIFYSLRDQLCEMTGEGVIERFIVLKESVTPDHGLFLVSVEMSPVEQTEIIDNISQLPLAEVTSILNPLL